MKQYDSPLGIIFIFIGLAICITTFPFLRITYTLFDGAYEVGVTIAMALTFIPFVFSVMGFAVGCVFLATGVMVCLCYTEEKKKQKSGRHKDSSKSPAGKTLPPEHKMGIVSSLILLFSTVMVIIAVLILLIEI